MSSCYSTILLIFLSQTRALLPILLGGAIACRPATPERPRILEQRVEIAATASTGSALRPQSLGLGSALPTTSLVGSTPSVSVERSRPAQARASWLGIEISSHAGALFIESVHRGSPAEHAGLLPGDRLVRLGEVSCSNEAAFERQQRVLPLGVPIALSFVRQTALRLVRITPIALPTLEQRLRYLHIGRKAPSISTLQTVHGSQLPSLQANLGRVVVLEFWAAWCEPCRALTPILNGWAADRAAEGLTVFAITQDPFEEASATALALGLEFPLFWDEGGRVSTQYGASALPLLLVIDRAGVVRDLMVGLQSSKLKHVEQLVEQLLSVTEPLPDGRLPGAGRRGVVE